jgi:hypothetical protein
VIDYWYPAKPVQLHERFSAQYVVIGVASDYLAGHHLSDRNRVWSLALCVSRHRNFPIRYHPQQGTVAISADHWNESAIALPHDLGCAINGVVDVTNSDLTSHQFCDFHLYIPSDGIGLPNSCQFISKQQAIVVLGELLEERARGCSRSRHLI